MADMMEKPLNGAGLAELWALIGEKFGKRAVGTYTGTATVDSSYNVSNPTKEVFVGFKPKFIFVLGEYINYEKYQVVGVGNFEYRYNGIAAWYEHLQNFKAFNVRPNVTDDMTTYTNIKATVTATDTGFIITSIADGVGPNYKDIVYDFIAIG